jgi:hypothetical protein
VTVGVANVILWVGGWCAGLYVGSRHIGWSWGGFAALFVYALAVFIVSGLVRLIGDERW